jgi:hypothetical protein
VQAQLKGDKIKAAAEMNAQTEDAAARNGYFNSTDQ